MAKLKKEDYNNERQKSYERHDQEAILRYRKVMQWIDMSKQPSIIEIGCKFGELYRISLETDSGLSYKAMDIDIDIESLKIFPNTIMICLSLEMLMTACLFLMIVHTISFVQR